LQGISACRRSCAHCCHIPVTISNVEATLIGHHMGLAPTSPVESVGLDAFADLTDAVAALQSFSADMALSPCPFLREAVCSSYEVRPLACRLLLKLDDDDLLCQRVPDRDVRLPYAYSNARKALFLLAQPAAPLADIRAFFARQEGVNDASAGTGGEG
jgi:hypothetical protein